MVHTTGPRRLMRLVLNGFLFLLLLVHAASSEQSHLVGLLPLLAILYWTVKSAIASVFASITSFHLTSSG